MLVSLALFTLLFACCYSFTPRPERRSGRLHLSLSSLRLSASSTEQALTKTSPSVVCIGDALLDCIATDDARGWTVEEMVLENKWTAFPGGAPANVATACCKLGTSAAFCGCLGKDADGDQLEELLRETGVDVSLLQRTSTLPTRRVMVTRSLEGDREFGGFYEGRAADEFADCLLDASKLFPQADDILKNAKWMASSTLSLAFQQSGEAVHKLVDRGIETGVRLLVDVNWRPVFWKKPVETAREEILTFTQKADVVKLTDEEAEWLLGIPAAKALDDPLVVHQEFPTALAVLVTAGEKGSSYSMCGSVGRVEAVQVNVVETTGAGDAFTAGFLHGLLSRGDVDSLSKDEMALIADDLVRFATVVGALTCTREGAIAAQPTFQEVESFLTHGDEV